MARRQRRSFSPEFRYEAANLVAEQGYSYAEAGRAVDVHENTIRNWVQQLESEQSGQTPKSRAMTAEQQRIQELEARVNRLEREKSILKKATVDSSGQCNSFTILLICMSTSDETSKTYIHTR